MFARVAGLLLALVISTTAEASGEMYNVPIEKLDSFNCTYMGQTFGYWKEGRVLTGNSEPAVKQDQLNFQIRSIDPYQGTAWLRVGWDEYEIEVLDSFHSLTLLDRGNTGALRMITIFPYLCPERRAFCSVMSEHSGRSGASSPTQAFGFCTPE